uniref:diacylglycerol O-acyltransferase n=1 Tax=Ascaris lumbricoides TaxID=6252 RepID=A0A0M3IWK8_ASCLU
MRSQTDLHKKHHTENIEHDWKLIGRPIVVEKNLNPSQEEIDALHNEYCTQLKKLFDEYKVNFGIDKNITLNIY